MTSEFRKALFWIDTCPNAPKHYTKAGNEINRETIRRALLIADRLMQEPSKKMSMAGYARGSCEDTFKAMRDQMLKEINQ